MGEQEASGWRAIEAALLEFDRAPGRHKLRLRQPPLLFSSLREVLQIAGERRTGDGAPPPGDPVVRAARCFVRAALLREGADHYELLGLLPNASAGEIKDRYRLLIRLMHPDFSSAAAGWPPDTASRINLAYDVLSSPERRKAYDEALARAAAPSPPAPARPQPEARTARGAQSRAAPEDPRKVLRALAAGFGTLGAMALLATWLAGAQERDVLVQRAGIALGGAAPAPQPSLSPPEPQWAASAWGVAAPDVPAALRSALPVASSAPDPAPPAVAEAPPSTPLPAVAQLARAEPEPLPAAAQPAPIAAALAVSERPVSERPVSAPVAPPSRPKLSVAEVQPLMMRLLQQVEGGRGDDVIGELADTGARRSADAQTLARQIDQMFEGVRPVRVTGTDFRGDPQDGRLTLVGQVTLQVRDPSAPTRVLKLSAEFAERQGVPVLARLSLAP